MNSRQISRTQRFSITQNRCFPSWGSRVRTSLPALVSTPCNRIGYKGFCIFFWLPKVSQAKLFAIRKLQWVKVLRYILKCFMIVFSFFWALPYGRATLLTTTHQPENVGALGISQAQSNCTDIFIVAACAVSQSSTNADLYAHAKAYRI